MEMDERNLLKKWVNNWVKEMGKQIGDRNG